MLRLYAHWLSELEISISDLICKMDMPVQASAMMEDDQNELGSSSTSRMPMSIFDISRKGLNGLAVSPDGTRLATAARDGVVRIHDLTNGALVATFRVRIPRALVLYYHISSCLHLMNAGSQTAQAIVVS
jgi:WD40 repeat protein